MNAASRHAPPLRVEIVSQPALQLAVAFLALLSQAALLAAFAAHGYGPYGLSFVSLPAAALLGWCAARVRPRLLLWDGQCWRLHECDALGSPREPGQEVRLKAVFDFDGAMLLRAQPQEPASPWWRWAYSALVPIYLPLSRRRQAEVWPAMRATLFGARVGPGERL